MACRYIQIKDEDDDDQTKMMTTKLKGIRVEHYVCFD